MNWLNVQENLTTIVGSVTGVDHVTLAPGFVDIARDGVTVALAPPARRTELRPGDRPVRYAQGMSAVIRARGPGSDIADHAATLSAVVDEISAALVAPSNRGGLAPMPEGPSWEEASLVEYPPGSENLFIQMTGAVVMDVYS